MVAVVARKAGARKGEISSAKVLEIAADLFREHGYASTTMRHIADAAGMKAGSLYYHFASKDEILDQVLDRGIVATIQGFRDALDSLPADAGFAERFRAAVTAHIRTVHDFGNYTVASRQLLRHVPKSVREKHSVMRRTYDEMWTALLRAGHDEGYIDLTSGVVRLFLFGALNWTSEWADPHKKSLDDIGSIAADLFLNGLVKRDICTAGSTGKPKRPRARPTEQKVRM